MNPNEAREESVRADERTRERALIGAIRRYVDIDDERKRISDLTDAVRTLLTYIDEDEQWIAELERDLAAANTLLKTTLALRALGQSEEVKP